MSGHDHVLHVKTLGRVVVGFELEHVEDVLLYEDCPDRSCPLAVHMPGMCSVCGCHLADGYRPGDRSALWHHAPGPGMTTCCCGGDNGTGIVAHGVEHRRDLGAWCVLSGCACTQRPVLDAIEAQALALAAHADSGAVPVRLDYDGYRWTLVAFDEEA